MIRKTIAAAMLLLATPLAAQSQQEALQTRYDRALAAGYKALFLCSAIANAERAGASRSVDSIAHWELTGVNARHDAYVSEFDYALVRAANGGLDYVSVAWDDNMPPRIARHRAAEGCAIAPIGTDAQPSEFAIPKSIYAGHPIRLAPLVPPSGAMEDVIAGAFAGQYGDGSRTTAVLVRRNDATIAESYAEGFEILVPQRTWSVAKSIAATLVGAAVHRGEADVTASAELGENESDPRRVITIDHLLRMASGRYSDTPGNRTEPLYWGGASIEESATHWPLVAAPGTTFRYANNDTLMAVRAIKSGFDRHSPAAFFEKLGMRSTVAETDWQGDYVLSSQVWSTARDLALLGQLYLDDGVLPTGERILPEGWVDYVASPSGPQPDGPFGYGAGFWLLNDSDGVPADTFAAMGNRGQYVVIVPSMNTVIVRRGEDPSGSRFDIAAFTRDVLEKLRE